MSTTDPLIADFEQLLDRRTERFSLQEWQYAYKKVIFNMGLKILERFPQNAFGPPPPPPMPAGAGGEPGSGHGPTKSPTKGLPPFAYGGGPTGGPIIHMAITVLELAPPPPPPPP